MRIAPLLVFVLLSSTAYAEDIEFAPEPARKTKHAKKKKPVLAPAKEPEAPPAPPVEPKPVPAKDTETPPGLPTPKTDGLKAASKTDGSKSGDAKAASNTDGSKSGDARAASKTDSKANAASSEVASNRDASSKAATSRETVSNTSSAATSSDTVSNRDTDASPKADASDAAAESTDAPTKAAPVRTAATENAAEGPTSVAAKAEVGRPDKWLEPYGAIAGGMHLESLKQAPGVETESQNPTVAVSRIGLRGGVGKYVTFASAFEASLGGPLGYGSSVWEGQAAVAIRDQYLRYSRAGFSVAAGRINDPASFDFVSAHMGDLLYSDKYTRDPLLYAGADRGNGIFGSYDINEHVTVAGTFHSTNPTGITGTLVIGGKLTPFDRPFYLAAAQVGNSQNNLPDQNLHIYFGSPSVMFKSQFVDAQAELQMYMLDTQQAVEEDQSIRGYNFRIGARGKFPIAVGKLTPFLNVSRNKNEILDPIDSMYRLPDLFKSYTVTTGVDWDYKKKNGIGFMYALVDTREPDHHTREHYLNLGTTYWIEDSVAVGVRASVFNQQLSGEAMSTGSRSLFVTARLVLE